MYDRHARIAALCCFVTVVSGHAAARAEQVVVTDVTYTHSKDTTENSHYRVAPRQGSPANWVSPVDYTKGSVHIVVEVKTKPGDTPTKFQICFEGNPNYACTDQSPPYTATGKQEWDSPFSKFWYSGDMDWSKGIQQVALILKDTQNMPRTEAAYLPTDLRVEVTLMSDGETKPAGAAGAAAPAAGASAPAAGRPAGTAGMLAPDAADGGKGGSGAAGAAAGAGAAGTRAAGGPAAAGAPPAVGAAGSTTAVAGSGAPGTRSTAGASGARSAGSKAGAGGTAQGSRSDAEAEDEFQYPSGNESKCSVAGPLGAAPTVTHVAWPAIFACAFIARARRRRLRRQSLGV